MMNVEMKGQRACTMGNSSHQLHKPQSRRYAWHALCPPNSLCPCSHPS